MLLKENIIHDINIKNSSEFEQKEYFDKLAGEWWNPKGKFKHIHKFNSIRFEIFINSILNHFKLNINDALPLKNLKILDIGCGAGMVSEALAKKGADVTGIDPSQMNIKIALQHAKEEGLKVNYINCLADKIISDGIKYDAVLNTEVIEHVKNQDLLIKQTAQCVKENGLVIFATINKTIRSFVGGILGAEYILRMLPKGTHNWNFFVKPIVLEKKLMENNVFTKKLIGINYNLLKSQWLKSKNNSINYVLIAEKQST